MKAFLLDRYGKGRKLTLSEVAEPVVASGEVLIEIHATALNLDSKLRDGAFKPIVPYKPPLILGHDLAGLVVAVGPGARRFKVEHRFDRHRPDRDEEVGDARIVHHAAPSMSSSTRPNGRARSAKA